MKIETRHNGISRKFVVVDENGNDIGGITSSSSRMMRWLEDEGIWENGDEMKIEEKYPNVKTGTMLYAINDPKKEPYRWKTWDFSERCSEMYDFIDPEEASYTFKLKLPWDK